MEKYRLFIIYVGLPENQNSKIATGNYCLCKSVDKQQKSMP